MSGLKTRTTIDVERLVTWALRDQGLGWDRPSRASAMESYAALGTLIDAGRGLPVPNASLLSDTDAIYVRQAIDGLPPDARGLVLVYGRSGTRPPGADEPMPEPEQLRNKRGQPMWDYAEPGNRRSARTPKLDLMGWSRAKEQVAFARAQWRLWREALTTLVEPLNQVLQRHRAIGPEAPARPWENPAPVVHGMAAAEPSSAPQPWLPSRRGLERNHDLTADALRAEASPESARAEDWSTPRGGVLKPRSRRRKRPESGENPTLSRVAVSGTHGRS